MSAPRGLSAQEAALWERLAATVDPLSGRPVRTEDPGRSGPKPGASAAVPAEVGVGAKMRTGKAGPGGKVVKAAAIATPAERGTHLNERHGLDTGWERKLARGTAAPDYTLDLHGASLDQAHARLDHGLVQAKAMSARVVLLITGKPRGACSADRGQHRGAIRAKVLDWLASGPHGSDIAAIRGAHRHHGGDGALYLILRRRR